MSEDTVNFTLRLPRWLHEQIRLWASQENRSLQRQVIHILQRAVEDREREAAMEAKEAQDG